MGEIIKKAWPKLLPLDLQFFAENDPPPADPPGGAGNPPPTDPPPADPPKTFTQDEFESELKRRISAEKKAADKAIEEAKKLAKMNEDQKKEYELDKLKRELDDYKKKDAFNSLSREAAKMLTEAAITADENLLSFVVKETAEDTQAAVKSFVALINTKVEEGVKKALAGKPPKVNTSTSTKTKQQIMDIKDPIERQKQIKENIQLFQ